MRRKIMWIILMGIAFIMIYPIIFIVTGSFMSGTELKEYFTPVLEGTSEYAIFRFLPYMPTVRHYIHLLLDSPEFFIMFWNSVKLTLFILLGQLFVGVPAAWGFAKYDFPLRKIIFLLYIVLMMMPFQVTMLSNYLVLDKMHLIDTHFAVIFPAVFSTFPIFIMYRFFCGVPDAIIESAKIDGAGAIQIFVYFGLPLGSAGIVSAMVLNFLEYWNLIEQPLAFLKNKELWPLSLYLPNISLDNAGTAFTASVVMLIPAVFVFLSGQDYLEQGIVASAIKE